MLAVTFDMDGLMFNTEDVYTLTGSEFCRGGGGGESRTIFRIIKRTTDAY